MDPLAFQVTFDAGDPHAQARFWAALLGWDVEIGTATIRSIIDQGLATLDDVIEIDGELFWKVGAAISHPGGRGDPLDGSLGGRRLLFMAVPEGKTTKNRVHLDLGVGPDRREAEVARACELGARVLYEVDEPSGHHVTLADPEGNEFCIQ